MQPVKCPRSSGGDNYDYRLLSRRPQRPQSPCGRRRHSLSRGGPVSSNMISITTGVMKIDMTKVPKKPRRRWLPHSPVRRQNMRYIMTPIVMAIMPLLSSSCRFPRRCVAEQLRRLASRAGAARAGRRRGWRCGPGRSGSNAQLLPLCLDEFAIVRRVEVEKRPA